MDSCIIYDMASLVFDKSSHGEAKFDKIKQTHTRFGGGNS